MFAEQFLVSHIKGRRTSSLIPFNIIFICLSRGHGGMPARFHSRAAIQTRWRPTWERVARDATHSTRSLCRPARYCRLRTPEPGHPHPPPPTSRENDSRHKKKERKRKEKKRKEKKRKEKKRKEKKRKEKKRKEKKRKEKKRKEKKRKEKKRKEKKRKEKKRKEKKRKEKKRKEKKRKEKKRKEKKRKEKKRKEKKRKEKKRKEKKRKEKKRKEKKRKEKKRKEKKDAALRKNRGVPYTSYVIRNGHRKGTLLIKIQIFNLKDNPGPYSPADAQCRSSECDVPAVKMQYSMRNML
ncbi:unnamed protein product [Chilo suppressalis]|uniref:Uncharacterized protein n=1 Tax=Chilo suppressalis TaxID=168631 RepID=A0ABN8AVM9_CHISP|nr:unnamed protein product [Chilo suppressalis]